MTGGDQPHAPVRSRRPDVALRIDAIGRREQTGNVWHGQRVAHEAEHRAPARIDTHPLDRSRPVPAPRQVVRGHTDARRLGDFGHHRLASRAAAVEQAGIPGELEYDLVKLDAEAREARVLQLELAPPRRQQRHRRAIAVGQYAQHQLTPHVQAVAARELPDRADPGDRGRSLDQANDAVEDRAERQCVGSVGPPAEALEHAGVVGSGGEPRQRQ